MNDDSNSSGFTIVEVLMVLAVSSILLLSAIYVVAGKVSKTQFTQAIQEIQTKLQQTINDVANGYYPNKANFKCVVSGTTLDIDTGIKTQGTNQDCTFLGKAIQFSVGSSGSTAFNLYTIAGLRLDTTVTPAQEVTSLSQAEPVIIAQAAGQNLNGFHYSVDIDAYEQLNLQNGLTVTNNGMYYDNNPANAIGTMAFITSFGSYSGGNLTSQSQQVSLYYIPNTNLGQPVTTEAVIIDNNLVRAATPANGIQICFKSGGTNESGLVTIGGANGRQLSVTLAVKDNLTCS